MWSNIIIDFLDLEQEVNFNNNFVFKIEEVD